MIDIHTHLYFPQYDTDRSETIRRAFDAGVRYMVSVGTEPDDWEQARGIAQRDGRIGLAVGIHPNQGIRSKEYEVRENTGVQIQSLKEFITANRGEVVAIGECGLDYFSRDGVLMTEDQKTFQKERFVAQIGLAQELNLPLIIHTRPASGSMDAYEDILSLLSASYFSLPVILHCYMGDTEVTRKFLELPDVSFSFTGNITYPAKKPLVGTRDDLGETVKMIPVDRILTETDCPFLAPQAHRGRRNEPAYVSEVVRRIAELKGVSIDDIEGATEKNAERIFGGPRL